jgi:MFS transporter, SP family, arabinose:H+ symporter
VCVIVQFVFPWEMKILGASHTFLIYGVFALAGIAFIWRLVPETRGRSLEEIEDALVRRTPSQA